MVSIKRRVAAASSFFVILPLGLWCYFETWKQLLSYLPGSDAEYERDANEHNHDEHTDERHRQSRQTHSRSVDRFSNDTEEEFAPLMMDLQDQLWRWRGRPEQQQRHVPKSPACHPHFRYFSNETSRAWSDDTKFQRLYFYHARKAGGTSLANYFAMVAHHHGLKFEHAEWVEAEEPGTHELPTFYVTHLREPVDRSISHFRYQGRWDCSDLSIHNKNIFIPTEENAKKIETWNSTGGHSPHLCIDHFFKLGQCAVNCYIQWFSGACPEFDIPIEEQFQMAKTKLLRYNFIVVVEWLSDPEYASAVESFFGVPGVTARRSAYCEHSSHKANKLVPLTIENHTLDKLIELNVADINLYKDLTDCLDEDDEKGYNFPQLDAGRFDNTSSAQVHYSEYMEWKRKNSDRRKQRGNPEKVKTSIEETNEDEI